MFFVLSKLLDIFLSPLTWGLMLLAAGVPWRTRARSARLARRRRMLGAAGLAVILIASSSWVSDALMWRLEHTSTPTYRDDVVYDAVVLLGGIVDEEPSERSGQPSYNDNVERVVMTHRLVRDGKARVAIVSGAAISPAYAAYGDGVYLARQLEDWGVPKDRIIVEDRARNTHENAVFTKEIVRAHGWGRVLVVTSAFHMARAAECFAAVDMKVDTLAVDYRGHQHNALSDLLPRAGDLGRTTMILREMAGRWIYRVQGYGKAVP